MRYAFVDGDILAFKASSAVQKDIDWGDGLWTCHAEVDDAWDYFTDMLIAIDEKLNKHFIGEEITYVFSNILLLSVLALEKARSLTLVHALFSRA